MGREHAVNVIVSQESGGPERVLSSNRRVLRDWFIRKLFGEAREILILKPGESVRRVEIREVKGV